jgi:hypothetical protein
MSGRSQLSSQPKSSVTVLSSLRQRDHRGASRKKMPRTSASSARSDLLYSAEASAIGHEVVLPAEVASHEVARLARVAL